MLVREPVSAEEAESLAQFARDRFSPHLDTWYCGGFPFLLEDQLRGLFEDPERCVLVAFDGDTPLGYTVVRRSDQFCEAFCPDPLRAQDAFTLLVEECCQRFPNMWGNAVSSEFGLFLRLNVSRRVVYEPPYTYRIVDP